MKFQKREHGRTENLLPYGKESFFSRHVQGITFLVVIALFLTFFGPLNVIRLQEMLARKSSAEELKQMTVEEAIQLSEKSASLSFAALKQYAGTLAESDGAERYSIEFDDYIILAVSNSKNKLVVYLANLETGEQCNFLQDDVAAFFARQSLPERKGSL